MQQSLEKPPLAHHGPSLRRVSAAVPLQRDVVLVRLAQHRLTLLGIAAGALAAAGAGGGGAVVHCGVGDLQDAHAQLGDVSGAGRRGGDKI